MIKTKAVFIVMIACFINSKLLAQFIHIKTQHNSLIFQVDSNNKLYQTHYGKYINQTQGLEKMTVVFNEAYPSFGNGSSDEVAVMATHSDGTMVTDLFYVSHEQNKQANLQSTVIHLKDEKKDFYVDLHFNAYTAEDVIEQWTTISHKENKEVVLSQYASSAVGFLATNYYLSHFHGSHSKEMMFAEEHLTNGVKTIETKRGVRTTEYENPSFMLSLNGKAKENEGEVIAGALAWTGNFRFAFQLDDKNRCQIISGINPFASDYKLKAKEKLETPRMVLTYSDEGKNRASINLHRWIKKYNLRAGDQARSIVLNSWEGAYFSFDATRLKAMMDGAAEMGVETFVLDDGWFGNKYPRNNARAGLGDWQVNQKKLPAGIEDLVQYAESKGMRFGIWVEPEMVNPRSELAEKHPEWIIQRKNDRSPLLERNQLLLDLSNPKVQEFVFNVIDELLTSHPRIAYVKWDANRHVQNFGSTYLEQDKQSHLFVEYTKGLEKVLERLVKKYSGTIFQACASGGGRVDLASMRYTHEFWASDNTDPYERLLTQWGTNHIYPPIATAAHVTKSPNHQTGRQTSLKFRFDVAMGGRLGMELRPEDMDEEEVKFAKEAIATYKSIRPIIQFGDLYRLLSPYDQNGYAALNYVSENKKEAILMTYSLNHHRRYERCFVKMAGLNPDAVYEVEEINKESNKSVIGFDKQLVSGEILMDRGIWVDLRKPLQSAVFQLTETN